MTTARPAGLSGRPTPASPQGGRRGRSRGNDHLPSRPTNRPARALAVIETAPPSPPADRPTERARDRRLTAAGLGAAIAFLGAGLASLALPPDARLGAWLPLHLVLAGGAGTAIAAMVPFFTAALTVAPPAPFALRVLGLMGLGLGAAVAAIGRALAGPGSSLVAAAGGAVYMAGAVAVLAATAVVLRGARGSRRPATELAYVVALPEVVVGAALAALFLGGSPAVVAGWAWLKPAHAWLNVFGFVTLVIAGSLAHLAPTVAGARIRRRPWAVASIAGLAVGAPLAAAGYAFNADALVRLGALASLAGAGALTVHGWQAHRDRFAWTTDHAWHAFTSGSLLAAPAWLLAATGIAAFRIAEFGADPAGWRLGELLAPLVAGFVVQVLLGALSHLLPAVGPGRPERHAVERRVLGRDGSLRLVAWNLAAGAATVGVLADSTVVVTASIAILVADLAATLLLLVACVVGRR